MKTEKYFKESLPEIIEGYEKRRQQTEMASYVEECLEDGGTLVIEAGTGTGKTLAYLIPLAKKSIEEGCRVIVSTYSKTLQQQIIKKDLPVLKRIFPELKFDTLFGSANYVCKRRASYVADKMPLFANASGPDELLDFIYDGDGLRENTPFHVPEDEWAKLNRIREECFEEACIYFKKCHYWNARHRLSRVNIIVVNHHLFFSDIMVDRKLLPGAEYIVFDEAHRVEDTMREMTGLKFSYLAFVKALHDAEDYLQKGRKTLKGGKRSKAVFASGLKDIFQSQIEDIKNSAELALIGSKKAVLVDKKLEIKFSAQEALNEIVSKLKVKALEQEDAGRQKLGMMIADELINQSMIMDAWLGRTVEGHFYWAEEIKGGFLDLVITPYNLADIFNENINPFYKSVIFTSATLSAGGDFSYIKKQFGINEAKCISLPSPFDFENRTILYIEKDMPEPGTPGFNEECALRIKQAIEMTGGGVLVLFTSNDMMRKVFELTVMQKHTVPLLIQGDAAPVKLIEKFKKEPSVLFAVSSFWQGIDVKGEALKCVVICRLPFEVPEHPLTKAVYRHVKDTGGNDFAEVALPRAVFALKQGFGRLIRGHEDYGAVMILDSRIVNKSYGKIFLKALPPSKCTFDIEDVKKFFKRFSS